MLTCTIIVLALSRHLESRYIHVILLVDILLHMYTWAVPSRNRTLFYCVFRPLSCSQCCSAELLLRAKLTHIYHVFMHLRCGCEPTLNGSSVLQRFEHSNVVEIRNRIVFDFYPGLPHILFPLLATSLKSS